MLNISFIIYYTFSVRDWQDLDSTDIKRTGRFTKCEIEAVLRGGGGGGRVADLVTRPVFGHPNPRQHKYSATFYRGTTNVTCLEVFSFM